MRLKPYVTEEQLIEQAEAVQRRHERAVLDQLARDREARSGFNLLPWLVFGSGVFLGVVASWLFSIVQQAVR